MNVYLVTLMDAETQGATILGVCSKIEKAKQYINDAPVEPNKEYAILVYQMDALGVPTRLNIQKDAGMEPVVRFPDGVRLLPDTNPEDYND